MNTKDGRKLAGNPNYLVVDFVTPNSPMLSHLLSFRPNRQVGRKRGRKLAGNLVLFFA